MIGKLLQPFWRLTRGQTLGAQCAIFDENGAVLLVRHGYRPGWHFPGGGVEHDETILMAAMRETREETGIMIDAEKAEFHGLFANFKAFPGDHVALFIVKTWERMETPSPNGEILEQKFFPVSELPAGTRDPVKRRLDEVLAGHPPTEYW